MPADIKSLSDRIRQTVIYKFEIIPHEVREQVALLEIPIPATTYRKPIEVASGITEAVAAYNSFRRIVDRAAICQESQVHEAGWNHHVHTPILDHIFGLAQPKRTSGRRPAVTARFESVMSAAIATDSIPYIVSNQTVPVLACSANSSGQDSETNASPGQAYRLSGSKKVDYVVMMYILESELLRQAIRLASYKEDSGGPHVNQTSYTTLRYSPIAVSIETKVSLSQTAALSQLGLWAAAGHKRLYQLRNKLFPPPISSWQQGDANVSTIRPTQPRLVSMPLIQVVGHGWHLYFACDMSSSIHVYGPIRLGSTEDIVDLYALVASLGYIKEWIETEFCDAMETWFMRESVESEVCWPQTLGPEPGPYIGWRPVMQVTGGFLAVFGIGLECYLE